MLHSCPIQSRTREHFHISKTQRVLFNVVIIKRAPALQSIRPMQHQYQCVPHSTATAHMLISNKTVSLSLQQTVTHHTPHTQPLHPTHRASNPRCEGKRKHHAQSTAVEHTHTHKKPADEKGGGQAAFHPAPCDLAMQRSRGNMSYPPFQKVTYPQLHTIYNALITWLGAIVRHSHITIHNKLSSAALGGANNSYKTWHANCRQDAATIGGVVYITHCHVHRALPRDES